MAPLKYPQWRPVWAKQAALFYGGLARQLQAGISPAHAKFTADPKVVGPGFAALTQHVAQRTAKGQSLADALRAAPQLVGPAERAALAAAEKAGRLPEVLELLAKQAEAQHRRHLALGVRLAYPVALASLASLIAPLKRLLLEGLGPYLASALPGLLGTLGLALGLAWLWTAPAAADARWRLTAALCGLPGPGQSIRALARARFFLLVGMGVEAGLGLSEAVASAGKASPDPAMVQAARQVATQLGRGASLAESLARHEAVVPALWRQVAASGEEAGSLPEALARQAGNEEHDAQRALGLWFGALAGALTLVVLGSVAYQILKQGLRAIDPAGRGAPGEESLQID